MTENDTKYSLYELAFIFNRPHLATNVLLYWIFNYVVLDTAIITRVVMTASVILSKPVRGHQQQKFVYLQYLL